MHRFLIVIEKAGNNFSACSPDLPHAERDEPGHLGGEEPGCPRPLRRPPWLAGASARAA